MLTIPLYTLLMMVSWGGDVCIVWLLHSAGSKLIAPSGRVALL